MDKQLNHLKCTPAVYNLPPELWYMIIDHLENYEVNKVAMLDLHLYQILNPLLYRRDLHRGFAQSIRWAIWIGSVKMLDSIKDMCGKEKDIFQVAAEAFPRKDDAAWVCPWGSEQSMRHHNAQTNAIQDDIQDDDQNDSQDDNQEDNQDNSQDDGLTQESLLHLAAQSGHPAVIKWLLDQGADINATTAESTTYMDDPYDPYDTDEAKHPNLHDLFATSPSHFVDWPVPLAVDTTQDERENYFPKNSETWKWEVQPHWTALYIAMCNHNWDAAAMLIKKGASLYLDVNPDTHMNTGYTALHLAAYYHRADLIDLITGMIKRAHLPKTRAQLSGDWNDLPDWFWPGDPNWDWDAWRLKDAAYRDSCGNNPLHYALFCAESTSVQRGRRGIWTEPLWQTIGALRDCCYVNDENSSGYSALGLAVILNEAHVIEILNDKFIFDINLVRDEDGGSLFDEWMDRVAFHEQRFPPLPDCDSEFELAWCMPKELIKIGARLDLENFEVQEGNLWRNKTPLVRALEYASKGYDEILKVLMRAADGRNIARATLERTMLGICAEFGKASLLRPILEHYQRVHQYELTTAQATLLINTLLYSPEQQHESITLKDKVLTTALIVEFSEISERDLIASVLSATMTVSKEEQSALGLAQLGNGQSEEDQPFWEEDEWAHTRHDTKWMYADGDHGKEVIPEALLASWRY